MSLTDSNLKTFPLPKQIRRSSPFALILVAVFVIGFLAIFYSKPMAGELRRYELWLMLFDTLLQFGSSQETVSTTPSGWMYLPQRFPFLGYTVLLLVMAGAHGWLIDAACLRRLRLMVIERIVLIFGLGLACLSLVILGCGVLGWMTPLAIAAPSIVSAIIAAVISLRSPAVAATSDSDGSQIHANNCSPWLRWGCLLVIVPFALYLFDGSLSPPTDFDVREYHLQGPKEWFQNGSITFLRHNVYTSFPFLTEMLSLGGMIACNDWWQGALVGQCVLACFQLLSTLAVFAVGRRWMNESVAWFAALLYLTTPWTLRISLIAYAEGALTSYVIASAMMLLILLNGTRRERSLAFVIGLLAGSAMACKYTGLVSVVVPSFVLLVVAFWQNPNELSRRLLHAGAVFAVGVAIMIGPWLLRNLCDTGNPVYPLGYSVFGGIDWNTELNERWRAAHGPTEHNLSMILTKHFPDVTLDNTWTSGILFALAIPSVVLWRRDRRVLMLGLLSLWGFVTWWALTHRIDRFWIPVIPLLSILAASLWQVSSSKAWRSFLLIAIGLSTAANIQFCGLALVGYHAGLSDLTVARNTVVRADIRFLNESMPKDAKVLMVGDAEVFDCTFPLIYNTVFDDSFFEDWTSDPADASLPKLERRMLPADSIRATLKEQGITHVVVHWGEILRYREPGSYDYTAYVQPDRFQKLVEQNVLSPPQVLAARSWADMSPRNQQIVSSWPGSDQIIQGGTFHVIQLFEVVREKP